MIGPFTKGFMKIDSVTNSIRKNELTGETVAGIDIGSRQSKAVLLTGDDIYLAICPTGYDMQKTADGLLKNLLEQSSLRVSDLKYIVSTGYGRIALKFDDIPNRVVTEIACHGMGAHYLGDKVRTIIDIGGQDSKTIRIDPETGKVLDFAMNDKCAAGTGRFLERIANVLGLDIEEMGPLSLKAKNPVDISSQCIVFAESEVISDRAKEENIADIVAGIHKSVARRVSNLLSRVGIEREVLFTGGVSNNVGIRAAFEEMLGFPIQKSRLDTVYAGALGAAVYADRYAYQKSAKVIETSGTFKINLESLEDALESSKSERIHHTTGKRKTVGSLCAYVPLELFGAADVSYTRLVNQGTQNEIMAGENFTESVFCDLTKSIIGGFMTHNAEYDALDHVYTFYTCDCMRKSAEAIDQNYVPTTIYNLPRLSTSASSKKYLATEIRNFKSDLEELTGKSISDQDIAISIHKFNTARKNMRKISGFCKCEYPLLSGSEYEKIASSYYQLPIDVLLNEQQKILEQLENAKPNSGHPGPRIMLSGGVIANGDHKITDILEQLGANIVVEDNCTGIKPFLFDIPEHGNWAEDLAEGYLGQAPCARMKPLDKMIEHALNMAEEYKADGVVLYYLKFCPCYSMMIRKFEEAFQKKGIPVLIIASDYSQGDEGQIKIRVEAFLEMLKGVQVNGESFIRADKNTD